MSLVTIDADELKRLERVDRQARQREKATAERREKAEADPHSVTWYEKREHFLRLERSEIEQGRVRMLQPGLGRYKTMRVPPQRGAQVSAYIEFALRENDDEWTPPENRRERRRRQNADKKKGKPRRGHPARQEWGEHDIAPRKRFVRELTKLIREESDRVNIEQNGEVAVLLRVLARYTVPQLLEDFALEREGHEEALRIYLMAKCGDVLRMQEGIDASITGYVAWRTMDVR